MCVKVTNQVTDEEMGLGDVHQEFLHTKEDRREFYEDDNDYSIQDVTETKKATEKYRKQVWRNSERQGTQGMKERKTLETRNQEDARSKYTQC